MGLFGGAKRLNFELLENAKFFTPNGKYREKLQTQKTQRKT